MLGAKGEFVFLWGGGAAYNRRTKDCVRGVEMFAGIPVSWLIAMTVCHPACLSVERLLQDCKVSRTRRSGPGGQHRNKVETAVVVQHLPTGLRGEASERRSQQQNRKEAIHRLRIQLALTVRQPPAASLSSPWLERVQGGRISVSSQHMDFPALLAEALDVVYSHTFAMSQAAEQLHLSSSQLIKLLKVEGDALALVNQERQKLGESPLR